MMDRMGINMKEIDGVEEVIIRTSSKDIHIHGAQVSEVNAQGSRIFQVMGEVEEVERSGRSSPRRTSSWSSSRRTSPKRRPLWPWKNRTARSPRRSCG